ncbi:MAG: benzoyl-CoA reductase subunit D [Ignavibacteriaceae bacterium]|jgi:benzoyl-CoA reductase, bcr type, subunit D|nr:MAG: benzoyl-CoA reductase subunit D [Chlorobiota bacterium]KXK05763.1 MAG: Benzoyl-CoA reductase subunit D [Chlorobi bacterium OLB4]MBV6398405.1 Benzoyl-CoA reductase subunit D [Ignavibacteria bacterium]MCC6886003.1 benzoyl-CoA reductase subunit D [Ignavibacteriales bacterium]MCE7952747.1 benzoyl-CoA reductase subunit D [Chlorobi bacterium CHB7]MDL1886857.1 benzoyl-CoA reductase subunit D [Ignavibacteria bacterium CHB1]MEB2330233.1 benzoyl-CoA reductase subunit D [Ignavibacteriaceae bacte
MDNKVFTAGIDIGSNFIKLILMDYTVDNPIVIDKMTEKIRKRDPSQVADEMLQVIYRRHGIQYEDIGYLASTGEGDLIKRKKGHFYGMTTHARGGKFMYNDAVTVVDMGALYVRAIKISEDARVLDYKMTGQCASGSGQFVENISRYLGLSLEEVGSISLQADEPEVSSGICAVLAETDVINMVSRGISTPNIIKGIHLSIASRIIKLLSSLKAESPIMLTGGMALNEGMMQALEEQLAETGKKFELKTHPDAIYAGAMGAALWGGYRYYKLKEKELEAV